MLCPLVISSKDHQRVFFSYLYPSVPNNCGNLVSAVIDFCTSRARCNEENRSFTLLKSVLRWRHSGHVVGPKQRDGGHIDVPK